MSTLMHGCHPDRPCRHGPTPTLVYVCPSESAGPPNHYADVCKHFAQVRGWPLAETVVETTPERPLELREGWARVMEAVSDGSAEVIAVYDAAQIGLGLDEFEVMQRDLRMREVVLTAVDRAPR